MNKTAVIYDTTLRDGGQMRDIAFSLEDKLRISAELDSFGVHYIEGGWPSANPKDSMYYTEVRKLGLKTSKIAAFGSTHRPGLTPAKDPSVTGLLKAAPDAVTIVGKAWKLHVREVLRVTPDENLRIIERTVAFYRKKGLEVFFDAEHFFDGFLDDAEYAIACARAAANAGAGCVVMCDTNGGALPWQVREVTERVCAAISSEVGIHAHNDSGLAVANTITAIDAGAWQAHVTVNGYGERCGNADLCSVVPILSVKMGIQTVPKRNIQKLTSLARFVSELANRPLSANRPFVGDAAFTHKAGIHVDAMLKNALTYEHMPPETVGNTRGVLISDQAGKANVQHMAARMGLEIKGGRETTVCILDELKRAEFDGYKYEGAEGSFEILARKCMGSHKPFFELEGLRIFVNKPSGGDAIFSEATIQLRMGDKHEYTAAEGDGPVNALDNALRKALEPVFPCLRDVRLTDYKVRVLDERVGTAAKVRVLITSKDRDRSWSTVGVSTNVIQASWLALVDSIEYKLIKELEGD